MIDYPFALDRFQREAHDAIERSTNVVVAAPTGSGKTVVAEAGIERARRLGLRAFYTAPLKALSNQKFRDLSLRYGPGEVGLLTGDTVVEPGAPVVVMTTEVLRNMIYGASAALDRLGVVVLDEVHFLQDTYRGPVWEEVIVHLRRDVQLVCLSATVSNTAELAEWIATVRGPTVPIVETRRPVVLHDSYLAADRTNDRLVWLPTFVDNQPNPAGFRLDSPRARGRRDTGGSRGGGAPTARRRLAAPGRVETVELLADNDLLPAIYFIFSRTQCDEAARSVLDAGVRFTNDAECDVVHQRLDERLADLESGDLDALGYPQFAAQLEAGIAAHHAGMIPAFKEVVESCFADGLIKVVFATETLAVGINMPARTVVIEKLTKFTGDHHELLTAADYTQLTGRAGRRGIDDKGQAVVLWNPFVAFETVSTLAASRSFRLRSAFRPTYNMTANLIRTTTPDHARHLLNLSFAQFQSDRLVVSSEARLDRWEATARAARQRATSEFGDIWEYRSRRGHGRAAGDRQELDRALGQLRPGDVVDLVGPDVAGPVVVVSTATSSGSIRIRAIDGGATVVDVTAADVSARPTSLARVALPPVYDPRKRSYRDDIARRLASALRSSNGGPKRRSGRSGRREERRAAGGVADENRPSYHPVEADPDLAARMRAAGEAERAEREIERLTSQVDRHHHSLANDFTRIVDVLADRGHASVDRDGQEWSLTATGTMLSRVFHEADLLVVECLAGGDFDGLTAPELAGLLSTFVYEHRSPEPPPPPWFPTSRLRSRWGHIADRSAELADVEQRRGLAMHRPPDPGFVGAAHQWVAGKDLGDVLDDVDTTGGDFVRVMRQLVDLARQLALIAPDERTRRVATEVVGGGRRGVVADETVVAGSPA